MTISLFLAIVVSALSASNAKPCLGAAAMAEGTETTQSNSSSNVFLEQFYSTEYFSNLRNNYGYNDFGTCGHIAIEMVLTYYDTYWDDDIVPDNFEYCDSFSYELNEENEPIIKGGQSSPGSMPESTQKENYDSWKDYYEQLVLPKSDESLHYYLLTLDEPSRLTGVAGYPWILSDEGWRILTQKYLFEERGYDFSDFTFDFNNDEQGFSLPLEDFLIKYVSQGIPCFAIIDDGLLTQHMVVAYDYDETTGKIYFHGGYHDDQIHNEATNICYYKNKEEHLNKYYKRINTVMTFYPNYQRKETNNFKYTIGGETRYASMEQMAISSPILKNGGTNDAPPVFETKYPFWVGPGMNKQYSAYINFYDYMRGYAFSAKLDDSGKACINMNEWERVMKLPHNYFYAMIRLDDSVYVSKYKGKMFRFDDPRPYENHLHIDACDFGFESQYNYQPLETNLELRDWFVVHSSRLRCGYIENSFINLSPRREGAGKSYLELVWNAPIYTIQLGIALWNNEYFITDESEAYIEVQDSSGSWKKVCNLISEIQSGQLKAKINGFSRKQFTNQNGMFGMRITNNSEAIGDRNLNRLSIDQFVFADTYGERLLYDNY